MSGRCIKNFVVSHRTRCQDAEEQHHLITRATAGLQSDRYNHEYEKAIEQLEKHKMKSNEGNQKIMKIKSQAASGHDHLITKQHRVVWQTALFDFDQSLCDIEEDYENSTSNFLKFCCNYDTKFAEEFQHCQVAVDNEIKKFEKAVIVPINQLKEDILYRMKRFSNLSHKANEEVLIQLNSVKRQSDAVSTWLQQQRSLLDDELNNLKELNSKDEVMVPFEEAVPLDVFFQDDVNDDVRNSAIKMFIALHSRCKDDCDYQSKKICEFRNLLEIKTATWTLFELWMFDKVTEIYNHYCPLHLRHKLNHLLPDMINKLLQKSRWDIFEVSSIKLKIKFAHNTKRSLLASYHRNFNSLHTKVLALFSETIEAQNLVANREATKLEQQRICQKLHKELEYLHSRQDEIRKLETVIMKRKKKVEEEEKEAERKLTEQKRKDIREKIVAYHQTKARLAELSSAENEKRLCELKLELEKQRKHDQERIKFRQNLYNEKLLAALEASRQKEKEDLEKNRRLEVLRNLVAVEAASDWSRLVQDTAASRAKAGRSDDCDMKVQLFKLHGYTNNQIKKDMRVRVEAAMREAGVHDTDYARHLMKTLDPPIQPRRDNDSSGVWSTFNATC